MYHNAAGFIGLSEPWMTIGIGVLAIAVISWIAVLVNPLKNVIRARMDGGTKFAWIAFIMSSQPLGVILWRAAGRRRTGVAPR